MSDVDLRLPALLRYSAEGLSVILNVLLAAIEPGNEVVMTARFYVGAAEPGADRGRRTGPHAADSKAEEIRFGD